MLGSIVASALDVTSVTAQKQPRPHILTAQLDWKESNFQGGACFQRQRAEDLGGE